MSSSRNNLPWLNQNLKKMIKKKQKLYNKAKKSSNPDDNEIFKTHKKATALKIKKAHKDYVENILNKSLEDKNPKPFWNYIKQKRRDNVGIAPLKTADGQGLTSDSKTKADLLNAQFKSFFTKDDFSGALEFEGVPQPSIDNLTVTAEGLTKLLKNLNTKKACGPDAIPNIFLKEMLPK